VRGTANEVSERATLKGDATLLLTDQSARARLKAMAAASSIDPARLFAAVRLESAKPLTRLIHTRDAVTKALAGQ
jgi:hypothetical protein